MIPFLMFAVPIAAWSLFFWLLKTTPCRAAWFLLDMSGLVAAIFSVVFSARLAFDWNTAYWLHDLKTGDTISFPVISDSAYKDLYYGSPDLARGGSSSAVLTVASWHGSCLAPVYAGQSVAVSLDARSTFHLTVIGRAVRPEYRYLVEVPEPGCEIRYFVTPRGLATIKSTAKQAVIGARATEGPLLKARIQREEESVRPLH